MREEPVEILTSDSLTLEGRLALVGSTRGAVLCHPHPLYGGAMDNNVVLTARDALGALGISTLRFNFRGVGRSGGSFDQGVGERRDLAAARALLAEHVADVHVVAYSFGAWVAVSAFSGDLAAAPATLTLISPPVGFPETDFVGLTLPPCPVLVISGDLDQFGHARDVDRWLASASSAATVSRAVLEGVDHFYFGAEAALRAVLTERFGHHVVET